MLWLIQEDLLLFSIFSPLTFKFLYCQNNIVRLIALNRTSGGNRRGCTGSKMVHVFKWKDQKKKKKTSAVLQAPPTMLGRKDLSLASLNASVHIKLLLLYSDSTSAHLCLRPRACFNCIYPFLVLSCSSLAGTFVETFPLIPPLLPALALSSPLPSPAFYFPVLPPSALISTFLHLSPLPSPPPLLCGLFTPCIHSYFLLIFLIFLTHFHIYAVIFSSQVAFK